jgi:GNAT superfamily N-acetyltransferase
VSTALVRRITADDASRLREIRLRALESDPLAFASSLEVERDQPDESWEAWAAAASEGSDQCLFVAEAETGHFVAMAGAFRAAGEPRTLHVIAVWVDPERRRQGLGSVLVTDIVEWARTVDADALALWVVEDNESARGLYERLGFVATSRTQPVPSRTDLLEVRMELSLLEPGTSPAHRGRLPDGYVELQPMTGDELDAYLEWTVAYRAGELMQARDMDWMAAELKAQEAIAQELSSRAGPANHQLCGLRSGVADAAGAAPVVGWVWFSLTERAGGRVVVIHDLAVFEPHRRRGIARAAVGEVEDWAIRRGAAAMEVRVFTHNPAVGVFTSQGFSAISESASTVTLRKELSS